MAKSGLLLRLTIATSTLLYILTIVESARTGCREGKDMRKCENICTNGNCEIRAAVILSTNTTLIASVSSVMPTLELAEESIREMGILNSNTTIQWIYYDDKCDASYSLISAIDAYADDCVHVIFGPVCEYALAAIARITKFLGYHGTPQLTVGGLSFDFVKEKKTCDDEYYMLRRIGMVNFQDISHFIIDLMNNFQWKKTAIIYEAEGQYEVVGKGSCYLMTKSLSQFIRDDNKTFVPWEVRKETEDGYREKLRNTLGLKYTNVASFYALCRYEWRKVLLTYERNARYEVGGLFTCSLMMSTLIEMITRHGNISYTNWHFLYDGVNITDKLVDKIGYTYASESDSFD